VDDQRSSTEISDHVDDLDKQLKDAIHNYGIVQEELARLQREKLVLQIKIKDKQTILDKAKINKQELEAELRIQRSLFWKAKHAGL